MERFNKHFQQYLAIASIMLGFIYVFLITFVEIPASSVRFADTILGVVISTIITTIYNFFFGSSKSSSDKQKALESKIQKSPEND